MRARAYSSRDALTHYAAEAETEARRLAENRARCPRSAELYDAVRKHVSGWGYATREQLDGAEGARRRFVLAAEDALLRCIQGGVEVTEGGAARVLEHMVGA